MDYMGATVAGDLSEQEVIDTLIFLFAAGYDTSKNVLTLLMNHLLQRPEIYNRCAADFGYCVKVVEEGLRFTNPSTIPRLINEDFVYRDVLIPKDTMLFFSASVLGRDPSAFSRSRQFQPRPGTREPAFGVWARDAFMPWPIYCPRAVGRRPAPDRAAHDQACADRRYSLAAVSWGLGDSRATDYVHAGISRQALLFVNKEEAKKLYLFSGMGAGPAVASQARSGAKVFWFFFLKKNITINHIGP